MKHMNAVVQQLKAEREHTQKQLQQIDAALAALGSGSNGVSHTVSAAGRRRISLAQKARWAKAKGHAPKPKRTMSVAARRKMAAAQRARWAKVKRAA
jgi:nucleoid-associated protein YgaU